MSFDTIIVGGGPAGLTLATYLPGKTCLIEHEGLGGCHHVRRDNGRFAEHGPRVYSGAYVNVASVLKDIGTSFRDTFVPYEFSPEHIDGKRWYNSFSPKEMVAVSIAYCRYAFWDKTYGKDVSVLEWCRANGFSDKTIRYVDAVCSFSDGADSTRYSLNEFLSGFDQHTVFGFYEPRRAHDKHLFPLWKAYLENKDVTILGAHVERVIHESGKVRGVGTSDGKEARANRVIFAVPPASLVPVLKKSNLVEPGFDTFAKRTKYDPYWSVAFHFERDAKVLDHAGFRSTPWGLIYLDMPMIGEGTKVLSVAATKWNVPSPATGKTLAQHMRDDNNDVIAREILRQLRLPSKPVGIAIPTGKYYDTAFVAAAGAGHWPAAFTCCDGLFSVGTHNGLSDYNFTSMESAVQNALAFCGKKRRKCVHASDLLRVLVLILVAWATYSIVTRTIL